jgi:hypothetical protein
MAAAARVWHLFWVRSALGVVTGGFVLLRIAQPPGTICEPSGFNLGRTRKGRHAGKILACAPLLA